MKFKWIFAALVLANIGMWMWANWYKEPPLEARREAQAPIAPEKMRLLTEPGVRAAPRPTPPANPAPVVTAAPECLRLGPFTDAATVAEAEKKLTPYSAEISRHTEEIQAVTGYRVYLPPLPSREAAERQRTELTRLGFRDHALIQEAGLENAISLGWFSVEANAETRVRELAAKHVSARIQPLQQPRPRYWLDVRAPAAAATELRSLDWKDTGAAWQEQPCPAASPPPRPNETPG